MKEVAMELEGLRKWRKSILGIVENWIWKVLKVWLVQRYLRQAKSRDVQC